MDNVEEYDPDQGERIFAPPYITEEMATHFFSMFWGREDVYAKRGKNGYHLGDSIKDAGKKCFGINRIEDSATLEGLMDKTKNKSIHLHPSIHSLA